MNNKQDDTYINSVLDKAMSTVNDYKLVLTLSGGMDSSTLLYMAADRGFTEIHTVTFDYGQRHIRELDCVSLQLEEFQAKHPDIVVTNKVLDVSYIKELSPTSSLTNHSIDNPNVNECAGEAQPVSYVPFRNMQFLSICVAYAESKGAADVWYGAAQVDSLAGYFDGSQEFVDSINNVVSLNREHRIRVSAPLLVMSKREITLEAIRLNVHLDKTWTCYSNREDGLADATTPSSSLRLSGFIEAGYRDPIQYIQQEKINQMYDDKECMYIR